MLSVQGRGYDQGQAAMKLARAFTKSIHDTLATVLEERARFFKSLYDEVSKGPTKKQRYLDIGAGTLMNTKTFGEDFEEIYALDVKFTNRGSQEQKIQFIAGDAQALPLRASAADLVSMFSVIEHLPSPQKALCEAMRLLRPGGELVIQAPNPLFPVDLHTGLPNPFFIPRFARKTFLKALGYSNWLNNVYSHPKEKDLTRWLNTTMKLTGVRRVVYPSHFVPRRVRAIYSFLAKARFLNLVPPSYLYVYKVIP
jgi:ubiquinone/menaquinone biosynthesis C-methylase UbiE